MQSRTVIAILLAGSKSANAVACDDMVTLRLTTDLATQEGLKAGLLQAETDATAAKVAATKAYTAVVAKQKVILQELDTSPTMTTAAIKTAYTDAKAAVDAQTALIGVKQGLATAASALTANTAAAYLLQTSTAAAYAVYNNAAPASGDVGKNKKWLADRAVTRTELVKTQHAAEQTACAADVTTTAAAETLVTANYARRKLVSAAVKTLNDASAAGSLKANKLIYVPASNGSTTSTSTAYKKLQWDNAILTDGTGSTTTPKGTADTAVIGTKFQTFNTAQQLYVKEVNYAAGFLESAEEAKKFIYDDQSQGSAAAIYSTYWLSAQTNTNTLDGGQVMKLYKVNVGKVMVTNSSGAATAVAQKAARDAWRGLARAATDSSTKGMKLKDAYQATEVLFATNDDLATDYTALLAEDAKEAVAGSEAWYKLQEQIKKEFALDAVAVKAMVDAQVTYIANDLVYAKGIQTTANAAYDVLYAAKWNAADAYTKLQAAETAANAALATAKLYKQDNDNTLAEATKIWDVTKIRTAWYDTEVSESNALVVAATSAETAATLAKNANLSLITKTKAEMVVATDACKAAGYKLAQEARNAKNTADTKTAALVLKTKTDYDAKVKAHKGAAGAAGFPCAYPNGPAAKDRGERPKCNEELCCGAADRILRDGTKLTVETCQKKEGTTTYKFYPALKVGATVEPQPQTWKFYCISASARVFASSAAAIASMYMMS